jgi:hypothetical protein
MKLNSFFLSQFGFWVQNEEAIIKVAIPKILHNENFGNIKVYSLDLGISFPI